jgi:glycosyltransferase involved in cell wall biosynthesis
MKKNLLFVIPSLSSGGGERSLVNLLSQMDYNVYNVDLFLLNHEGLFMEYLPAEVNVLPIPENYCLFSLPIRRATWKLLLKGNYTLAFNRIMFSLRNRYARNISTREQYNWKYLSASFVQASVNYDVAIGFLEKTSTYYCVDKVNARKKVGWVHIDYDKMGMDSKFDQHYFDKLDHIVTVSEECAAILQNRFPKQRRKVNVIYNIVSPKVIQRLANQETWDVFARKDKEVVILSIGRLHRQKTFELAIEACKLLIERGYNIQWNIIGDGEERKKLTALIEANGLEDNFKLLGLKSNPYPYLRQADIYVQTSQFEGKSIAIDEAKIMSKPIVVTRFSTAKDQIDDGVNGLIVDMNSEAVASGVEKLIQDKQLRNQFVEHLSLLTLGTEDEIDKLYKLLV